MFEEGDLRFLYSGPDTPVAKARGRRVVLRRLGEEQYAVAADHRRSGGLPNCSSMVPLDRER